jgi:hypothetical protein
MSYDSGIVLAIKSGVLPIFCFCRGDDDDDADDEIRTSGCNKANVCWTNIFSPTSSYIFMPKM